MYVCVCVHVCVYVYVCVCVCVCVCMCVWLFLHPACGGAGWRSWPCICFPCVGRNDYHSSIAEKIPWTEKLGRLEFMGSQRVRHDQATNTHTHTPARGPNLVVGPSCSVILLCETKSEC